MHDAQHSGSQNHPAAWRVTGAAGFAGAAPFRAMAQTAEQGGLDAVLLGLPTAPRARRDSGKVDGIRLDPLPLLAAMIGVTEGRKIGAEKGLERFISVWDKSSKIAADYGLNVCWEFEPGFVFNKPSEIVKLVDAVRAKGNTNFGVLYDTCHAHMCAGVGANQTGAKETLPGGAKELLGQLKGKITHIHLIDSDGSLNEHNTSTHNPFGTGKLNFDKLVPAMQASGVPHDWWTVDLCFWPHAWDVTAQSKKFLDGLRAKY